MSGFNASLSDKVKQGPIIIVEDNPADAYLFKEALRTLDTGNQILHFENGIEALNFLQNGEQTPFLIISDINMPRLNGIELKREIDKDEILKMKAIPFIFMSSSAARRDIYEAFGAEAQGYFEKPMEIESLVRTMKLILDYWNTSELPAYY